MFWIHIEVGLYRVQDPWRNEIGLDRRQDFVSRLGEALRRRDLIADIRMMFRGGESECLDVNIRGRVINLIEIGL